MPQRENSDYQSVTVLGCQALARPDGRVALMLNTDQWGPIAFDVSPQIIEALQKDLAIAEQYLLRDIVRR
jgi:hypothetical protein